jgi:hypothetical protein
VRKCTLGVILLLTLPAFATISKVQSNAKWTCSGSGSSITCFVTLGATTANNLLAVWTFWESTFPYTAGVGDLGTPSNTFYGAVGPTLQSVSNTSAQIFYAKNINASSGGDTVTVTFTCPSTCVSPTITAGGIVAVEYSGADQNYPLDSVSAGYSTSGNPTGLLDSGTVAPANANLLVFAGGTSDNGTAIAGTNFSSIQNNGGSITEQNTNPISGNNTLQRATAGFNTLGVTGNWVMQMAVFRDASWTVSGGWSSVRAAQVRNADQFPGSDASVKVNACIADVLVAGGGTCDARGLNGVQSGLTKEIDVGGGTYPNNIGVSLILPSNAIWSWNIADTTKCGIKLYNGSAVYSDGGSGGGNHMSLRGTNSSTDMRALFCTDYDNGGYFRAARFGTYNPSSINATFVKANFDIEAAYDGSAFDDLQCGEGSTVGTNTCFLVAGLGYQSRLFHCVAEGGGGISGQPGALPIVVTNSPLQNTTAGVIDGCTANRPPALQSNITVTGTVDGLLILSPYMEGNTNDNTSATGFISLAASTYNVSVFGGSANTMKAHGTRPVVTTASSSPHISGMQAENTTGGIIDTAYGVTKPSIPLCCGDLSRVPEWDPNSSNSFEVGTVDLTAQTAGVGTTTVYAVPSFIGGSLLNGAQYRLSWDAKVTTIAGTGSTIGPLTITYTDPDGVPQTITASAQNKLGAIETTDVGNTTMSVMLGLPLLVNAKAGTNIRYAFGYASNPANAMAYNLHLKLDQQPAP